MNIIFSRIWIAGRNDVQNIPKIALWSRRKKNKKKLN